MSVGREGVERYVRDGYLWERWVHRDNSVTVERLAKAEWRVVGDPTVTLPNGVVQEFPPYLWLAPSEDDARTFVAKVTELAERDGSRWASGPRVQRRFVTEWEDE